MAKCTSGADSCLKNRSAVSEAAGLNPPAAVAVGNRCGAMSIFESPGRRFRVGRRVGQRVSALANVASTS